MTCRVPAAVIGRERELDALSAAATDAAAGRGCVVFLAGPTGSGKSELAEGVGRSDRRIRYRGGARACCVPAFGVGRAARCVPPTPRGAGRREHARRPGAQDRPADRPGRADPPRPGSRHRHDRRRRRQDRVRHRRLGARRPQGEAGRPRRRRRRHPAAHRRRPAAGARDRRGALDRRALVRGRRRPSPRTSTSTPSPSCCPTTPKPSTTRTRSRRLRADVRGKTCARDLPLDELDAAAVDEPARSALRRARRHPASAHGSTTRPGATSASSSSTC